MTERTPYKIRKRRDGVWEIYWNVKTVRDGKARWTTHRKSTRTTDQHKAAIALAHLTLKPEEKVDTGAPMSVAEACAAYITRYAAPKGQERSAKNKLRAPIEAFGDYGAAGIKDDDIAHYISARMFGRYGPMKVTDGTIRAEIVMLQAALNWAMKRRGETHRYRFEKPRDGERRDLWLDEDQERSIMEASRGWATDEQLFLHFGLIYAARRGAMIELEFGRQVDFRRKWIDFNRPGALKTRKLRPDGPMTPEVEALLKIRLDEVKGGRVLGPNIADRYADRMKEIDFEWVTPHVLKHSAITLQLRAGVPVDVVSRSTKTSPHTIMKHYRHHSEDELLSAMTRRRS